MMFCVIFNSAAPAEGRPLMAARRGGAAQEEKRRPTRTRARNPNVRSFTATIPAVARGERLKAVRRESCRIIRHLGSEIVWGGKNFTLPVDQNDSSAMVSTGQAYSVNHD
jgi:hypothetical protein